MSQKELTPDHDSDLLADRVRQGDGTALVELQRRHSPKLTRLLRSRISGMIDGRTVDDIVSDTWFKVWEKLKENRYRPEGKFFPWLYQIARNIIGGLLRRQGIRGEHEQDVQNRAAINPLGTAAERAHFEHLSDCVSRLSTEQQEMVHWRYDEDWQAQKIAEKLKKTPNRISEAFREIKDLLEECMGRKSQ